MCLWEICTLGEYIYIHYNNIISFCLIHFLCPEDESCIFSGYSLLLFYYRAIVAFMTIKIT